MRLARDLSLIAAIVLTGALLGAGLYEQVVMAPNYAHNIPQSLDHVKHFFGVANPGNLFRVLAPAAQVTLLLTLILNWKTGRRWWLLASLLLAVGADVVTFTFHYPRNAILFTDPMNTPIETLTRAAGEWAYGNCVRIILIAIGMICSTWAAMRAPAAGPIDVS